MKRLVVAVALFALASPLFAAADLTIQLRSPAGGSVLGGFYNAIGVIVQNNGDETARNVQLEVTSPVNVSCNCRLGDIAPRAAQIAFVEFVAPRAATNLRFDFEATSDTRERNPADNRASATIRVSTDPDLVVSVNPRRFVHADVPFEVNLFIGNLSYFDAHGVDVTLDFRGDAVAAAPLPAGCSSVAPGRIVCHRDVVPARDVNGIVGGNLRLLLVTSSPSGGEIVFNATIAGREHDFDESSNRATAQASVYESIYVTTTGDSGPGSLRDAIERANARWHDARLSAIEFRIAEPSPTPWKTIRVASPLPRLTATATEIDGGTQAQFFGRQNFEGPEIEISGGGTVDGDGLTITECSGGVRNLAINGFRGNGVSIARPDPPRCTGGGARLENIFIGTDPTGTEARPNGRGVGTSTENPAGVPATSIAINRCVISGNRNSGIFALSGRLVASGNRIGVKAHSDEPLPNGAAGIFIGPGGYGSIVGTFTSVIEAPATAGEANVIAFNGGAGIAVAAGVAEVSIRNNRIWQNGGLGIDLRMDGVTAAAPGITSAPVLTSAIFDPASNTTIVEGDFSPDPLSFGTFGIHIYANDQADPSGYGEGQTPIGVFAFAPTATHFRVAVPGDFRGRFVTATATRAKTAIALGTVLQTSEFSRAVAVTTPSAAVAGE